MPNPVDEARTVEGALARVDAETVVSDSVDTNSLTDGDDGGAWETLREIGYESGDVMTLGQVEAKGAESGNSNTSYADVAQTDVGTLDLESAPKSQVRLKYSCLVSLTDAGDTVFSRPQVANNDGLFSVLDELEVSFTGGTGFPLIDSGWVDPTSITADQMIKFNSPQAKISSSPAGTYNIQTPTLAVGVELP